jgi:hypothetical protein
MIFTGIKRKSNQIFIKNHLNDFFKKQIENEPAKVKNILIFVDDISVISEIKKEIFHYLKIEKKLIEIVVYNHKILKNNQVYQVITPKNFGWYGKLKQEKFPFSLTKKYDLLINYSKKDHLYLNLLLLQLDIRFRIGFAHLEDKFYNLLVNCKLNDISIFTKEIKKYLTILNKI